MLNSDMSCQTQALKQVSPNGCTDALGKRGDAEPSLTRHARKSESAAPFPQYHRLDYLGKVVLFINEGHGWTIHAAEGQFINPWTNKPFNQLLHAKNAIKFRLKHGCWPGKKSKLFRPATG